MSPDWETNVKKCKHFAANIISITHRLRRNCSEIHWGPYGEPAGNPVRNHIWSFLGTLCRLFGNLDMQHCSGTLSETHPAQSLYFGSRPQIFSCSGKNESNKRRTHKPHTDCNLYDITCSILKAHANEAMEDGGLLKVSYSSPSSIFTSRPLFGHEFSAHRQSPEFGCIVVLV